MGATNGRRRATATSNFGVSRRENHDATAFYERFTPPDLSEDETVLPPVPVERPFRVGDARDMSDLPDGSVALVVTSPPYFAGKQYEEELDREGVPGSYKEYIALLTGVFRECKRVLEPGGRIAVNVANLGRKPYRSLAADVIGILQDELGLLLRGEVVWQKGQGAGGNCAWGSFKQATNPSLRDLTERVVVASKGRFDRALSVEARRAAGLPHRSTVSADEFMAATLDVWQIGPESAKRVAHPAPFPVELPERLVLLYTYEDDLVLDPFLGSGSALVAAARHGRRYVGYDLDPAYCAIAERRVADELADAARRAAVAAPIPAPGGSDAVAALVEAPAAVAGPTPSDPPTASPAVGATAVASHLRAGSSPAVGAAGEAPGLSAGSSQAAGGAGGEFGPVGRARRRGPSRRAAAALLTDRDAEFQQRAVMTGMATPKLADSVLAEAGFTVVAEKRKLRGLGVDVSLVVADAEGDPWLVEVTGSFTTVRGGLRRPDLVWRVLGKALVIAASRPSLGELSGAPFLVLTSHLPAPGSEGDQALRAASPSAVFDAVELLDPVAVERLAVYAKGGHRRRPAPGFWAEHQLG
ncbi:MAG TPA: site-specific DNA-methyltransferase [Acidimicrobiales bacterium]|nr:site-specific DNA-methyltransferase [Acidimicrobiales bacterium]